VIDGPFRGTEALAAGVLTADQLRGPRFRRLFPDVYQLAALPLDLRRRSQAGYLLVRHHGGALAGYSAAVLLGADCAPAHAPVEVVLPGSLRRRPGLRPIRADLPGDDLVEVAGCRVTTAARTAWDLARRLPLVEAVVAVDALAHRGSFAPPELLVRAAVERGARGCRRLAEVVALAEPAAESPPETRLRVALVRAGLSRPVAQYRVVDEWDQVMARVDLAYPGAKLALEYDGAGHVDPRRTRRDKQRDAELAGYGWLTVRLLDDDLLALRRTVQRVAGLLDLRG
jgi:very-short-patch-repair endonuclease